jgi:hypothetical protein
MRKNEVYSWRVSSDLKQAIEEAARQHGISGAELLELAVRHWLAERATTSDDAEQERIKARARAAFGAVSGTDPTRSERTSELVKAKLRARRVR